MTNNVPAVIVSTTAISVNGLMTHDPLIPKQHIHTDRLHGQWHGNKSRILVNLLPSEFPSSVILPVSETRW